MMKLQRWIEQRWYASTPGTLRLLQPLECFYRYLQQRRSRAFQTGKKNSHHPGVPVIIVGNITVGGSGKSPVVAALADFFKQQGWKPGIVSRGYGGQATQYPLLVTPQTDPQRSGDEPLMLARQTGVPVAVDPDRPKAADLLVQQGCNLILSDDGLQHLALARDIELVVIDGTRGLGNGHCLPVGPLREPATRLQSVDHLLCQGELQSGLLITGSDQTPELIHYHLQQTGWRRGDGHWQQQMPFQPGETVHALAGIGHPQRFFEQLKQQGLVVIEHPLADHAHMDAQTLNLPGDHPIVMTAKDAVKLQPWLNARHWVVEVQAALPQTFLNTLQTQLKSLT
ncbi:tetraacyldisaccharide 4'-kinase [Marinospirillum alkaliphilum]|uniref:Tetraacyldisaccharide 4'-kinase n=1 Tax=Marinospirillum alkaliphilum DSM 21637 TaxID=1122209 RepID=A0A1K1U6W1_9GAMM|nr:tetraacyldisaccharide 4'-kinase [Marinospirillum alkaliphilum]SFX08536.1 lipid-A-disaccharide kinase [Marinospirillum alkaliphilum DSM 21637]